MSINDKADSDELQMLFDSISSTSQEQMATQPAPAPSQPQAEPAPQPAAAATTATAGGETEDELQALFDSIYAQQHVNQQQAAVDARREDKPELPQEFTEEDASEEVYDEAPALSSRDEMFQQVGQITRRLHEMLEQLGYEKMLSQTATEILPDTQQRLEYISSMTEKAAQKVLAATEVASPLMETISFESKSLQTRWESVFAQQLPVTEFRQLALDTRAFLAQTQESSEIAKSQLMEIMMAQDFQDLTGQVIKRIIDLAQDLQSQLLVFLIDNIPPDKKEEAESLMNGPVINQKEGEEVVTSQIQVDDLLESLGF